VLLECFPVARISDTNSPQVALIQMGVPIAEVDEYAVERTIVAHELGDRDTVAGPRMGPDVE